MILSIMSQAYWRKEIPMNRKQFLTEVEQRLSPLPAEVRNELLSDLSQHFDYGLVNGKSESGDCQ